MKFLAARFVGGWIAGTLLDACIPGRGLSWPVIIVVGSLCVYAENVGIRQERADVEKRAWDKASPGGEA